MPRRGSGPRLWFDKKRDSWTIIDGRSRHRTGCGAAEIKRAETALRDYIESKHRPAKTAAPILADVLATYAEEHIRHTVSGKHIQYDLVKLTKWWGAKQVTDITASSCRSYVAFRDAPGCAWREMAFLRAAVRHWQKEHAPQMAVPRITMPAKPTPRQDFMTRNEAARFLWAARKPVNGVSWRDTTSHLVRFFLIGWYTGSRRSVITGLKWSMIDLENGIMHRKPRNAIQTKKKAPPVRLGNRILAHLRRWHRMDQGKGPVIHFRGAPIHRPVRSWERIRRSAQLPDYVVPHILRHSRATHLLKAGVPVWEAAQSLGMSVEMLVKTYGHHSPDWQKDAANVR